MALPMGLQSKRIPDSLYRRFGQPTGLCHGPATPLCRSLRGRLQGLLHQSGNPFILDTAGAPWTIFIIQPFHPSLDKTLAPFAHGLPAHAHLLGDFAVMLACGCQQDNL